MDGQDVTGKFGLGFKSVFLVCDEPRIVSGRLAVVVVGGAYPLPLDAAEATAIRQRLPCETATLFELKLRNEAEDTVLKRFRRLAHLLPVFARCIRKIQVNDAEFTWSPKDILATESASVVVGRLDTDSGPTRALVVRCGELGDVLFGLNDKGFVPIPDDVPSVWVTAPTAEYHQLGYVVNARTLPIDIGRSQVAWAQPEAREEFNELAKILGETLVALFDAGMEKLEFSANTVSVWQSFWEVVKKQGQRPEIRDALMWGPGGAARRLFTERKALPTGWKETLYSNPTKLGDVRGVVVGIMVQQTDVFRMVAGWESFQREFPPGSLVAAEQIGDLLPELPRIDLAAVVQLEMESPFVDSSRATVLGQVLSPTRLNHLHDIGKEIERVRESLKVAQFRNAADQWVSATGLVSTGAEEEEERLRAGFAPPEQLLSPDYTDTAVKFFQACRGDMQISVEKLEGWVRAADTEEKRKAAQRYLGRGELRHTILSRLQFDPVAWLRNLSPEQMQAAGLNALERVQLSAVVCPPTTPATPPASRPQPDRVAKTLDDIADWWKDNRREQLKAYYARIYPGGRRPAVTADGSLQDAAVRKEWLKLLITGSLQTLGRVKAQQNREFIRITERQNWFGKLANPADGPQSWLTDVQLYVDDQRYHTDTIRYFHWLRNFIGIDTLARHLGTYAVVFQSIERFDGKITPSDVFTIRTSRQFQGTGLDAPPMLPFLGIGACFVLRELVRSGVVTRTDIHPFCYTPAHRLRERLHRLGWCVNGKDTPADRSRSVHEFLSKHHPTDPTFGGDFDIPLLMWSDWDTVP